MLVCNCRELYCYNFIHEGPENKDRLPAYVREVEEIIEVATAESTGGLQLVEDATEDLAEDLPEVEPIPSNHSREELEKLVDIALAELISERGSANATNTVKKYTVSGRFMPSELRDFKDEVSLIDRAKDGKSGQGGDMVQEEFLKKGLNKTATGKMNTFPVFRFDIFYFPLKVLINLSPVVDLVSVVLTLVISTRVQHQQLGGKEDSSFSLRPCRRP